MHATYLVDSLKVWTKPAMNTENAPINNSPEGQIIKNLAAISPYIRRPVFPLTLVIETIHLRDLTRLMIASDKRNAVRVAHFVGKEQEERLNGVEATVDKVAHE